MFDPKCWEIAYYFLPRPVHPPLVDELAQHVQDAIEDWLNAQDVPLEGNEGR